MTTNEYLFKSFLSILIDNMNESGKCHDEDVCCEIAHVINMHPKNVYWGPVLWDFIHEHGEDVEEIYMGRDEDGEKIFYVRNPETNWQERIRKELVKIGYYKPMPSLVQA